MYIGSTRIVSHYICQIQLMLCTGAMFVIVKMLECFLQNCQCVDLSPYKI